LIKKLFNWIVPSVPANATARQTVTILVMLPSCLIVALPAEARPFIKHFGLSAMNHPYLRLYHGDSGYLLQCGVGKLNAASGTAAMLQYLPDVAAIINVGIAGSDLPIGDTVIAHGVQDKASQQQWFPHLPPVRKLAGVSSVQVLSVDTPATDYSPEHAFDMEASGIFNAAAKVLDLAFVHSIKVISDNNQSGIQQINATSVVEQIGNAVPVVEKLLQSLPFDTLPCAKSVNALSTTLIDQMHYTTTETHTLKQLLHRYNALRGELPSTQSLLNLKSAKAVRQHLLSDISNARISY